MNGWCSVGARFARPSSTRPWNVDREVVPLAVETWRHLPDQMTLLQYSTVYV